jgi:DNA-binding GntR family transcriptional regulator
MTKQALPRSKRRLADVAYDRLVELIVSELPAGSRLSETELATTLGMSKTPVREALLRLESEGLVAPIPHVGYLIPHLSYVELREALEVREAVEGYLAMLAAERISDTELAELRSSFSDAQAAAAAEPDIATLRELNAALHASIMRAADNSRMEQILAAVRNQVDRGINELIGNDGARYRQSFEEHLAILDSLEAHDPARAELAMREHIRSVNTHILRRFR